MTLSSFLCRTSLFGLALTLVVGDASIAAAQGGRRPGIRRYQSATAEPSISPYINLVRPFSDPSFNYFSLVQPQLQQQQAAQIQGKQIQGLGRQLQQDEKMGPYGAINTLPATGSRVATRQNYSHYYPSRGGSGGGGGGASRRAYSSGGGGGGMGMGGGF
jgi:hypothetical protein